MVTRASARAQGSGIGPESHRQVLVGLGGNLGGNQAVMARFRAAALALAARLGSGPARWSGIYRSQPVGPVPEQPMFLNAVLALALREPVEPGRVLEILLAVEAELGRVRAAAIPKGPRTIDLDLLFVGERVARDPGPPPLELPHPRIAERAFVLQPLVDLQGPDWVMPGIGRTVAACLGDPELELQRAALEVHGQGREPV